MSRVSKSALLLLFGVCAYLSAEAVQPPERQLSARASLAAIDLYQATVSPALKSGGFQCRYTPTCSHYAEDAIGHYGFIEGSLRSGARIFRCSPWGSSGYDPAVSATASFRAVQEETPEQKAERLRTQEEFRKAQERLSKPADQAATDELFKAMRAPRPQETEEQRKAREQRDREEAERIARDVSKACGGGLVFCIFGIIASLVGIAVEIFMMVFAYKDAKARGDQNAVLWLVLIFFLHLIGFVVYMIARPKGDLSPCGSCKQKRMVTLTKCPHCGVDTGAAAAPPKAQ